MRDLNQKPYTTQERIAQRIAIEVLNWTDTGANNELITVGWVDDFNGFAPMGERLTTVEDAACIAALEAEHPTNLLAQTAIVRRDARDTTGPDLDAFAAAFTTALTQHDEEYL